MHKIKRFFHRLRIGFGVGFSGFMLADAYPTTEAFLRDLKTGVYLRYLATKEASRYSQTMKVD